MDATPTTTTSAEMPSATPDESYEPHGSPVVAFLIGLSIILLSSILNAGGLNLTKWDHIRTSALPKASRRKDYQRPAWVCGMLLYILSQLIGSTLALEYMRAEYVAPLGSTSLIFNFIFASFIGSPVSRMDIYGTIVVVLGVIGIVAFGSINSGLETEMDLARLKTIWSRGGWLSYFLLMGIGIVVVWVGTAQLDQVLASRADLSALPTTNPNSARPREGVKGFFQATKERWAGWMFILREFLESWTSAKDDKYVAWMLGIGWSCTGGALAGACLIFAKATVKLLSGSLSHRNEGNQFSHPAAIFTILLLGTTAVSQIICLNRGLKVYESTLVVPVFYGIYTAAGFLNSLIFNNEVDAYKTWTLFCLGISILVLIAGVVLLTHKKPPPNTHAGSNPELEGGDDEDTHTLGPVPSRALRRKATQTGEVGGDTAWEIGDDSDSDDEAKGSKLGDGLAKSPKRSPSLRQSPNTSRRPPSLPPLSPTRSRTAGSEPVNKHAGDEGRGLMGAHADDDDDEETDTDDRPIPLKYHKRREGHSSGSDDFGSWEDGGRNNDAR